MIEKQGKARHENFSLYELESGCYIRFPIEKSENES